MKYIIFRKGKFEVPIIFPNTFVHAMVADAMKRYAMLERQVIGRHEPLVSVAAGEVQFGDGVNCFGKSATLKLESRGEEDAQLIAMSDYGAGYVG